MFVENAFKTHRYGFNGKELDTEGMGGGLSTYDYGFRIYNPGICKFLSVDPLTASYAWYTPYQFAGNMPIWAIDLDGLEPSFKASSPNEVAEAPYSEGTDGKMHEWISNENLDWTYVSPEVDVSEYRYKEGESRVDKNGWSSNYWHQGSMDGSTKKGWYSYDEYEKIISSTIQTAVNRIFNGDMPNFDGKSTYWGPYTEELAIKEISEFYGTREVFDNSILNTILSRNAAENRQNMSDATRGGGATPLYCEDMFLGITPLLRSFIAKSIVKGGLILPKLGIPKLDAIDLASATGDDLFNYAKAYEGLYKAGKVEAITRSQAASLVKELRKKGVKVRIDEPHNAPNPWQMKHLNVGDKGQIHVPIKDK